MVRLKCEWRSVCRRHRGLLLALLFASIACLPLIGPGIVNTRAGGDSPFLLQRLHQLVIALREGGFPVRWMPDAAYGLGYPLFNFYASFPYYLAALLSLLGGGYTTALKLTQILGMLAASAAMYGFVRRATRNEAAALLSAAAYTYAPFHLVNVYVRGDSLSEFWAFVFYPLIFWALLSLRERPSVRRLASLALAYGCLVLTHNISAMIFTPFIVLYGLTLLSSMKANRLRFLSLCLAAGALGLALSAWFWVPALLERGRVQLQEMATGYFHFSEHFRWADLVQWRIYFDYTIDGHHTPFSMGLGQALLVAGGVVVILIWWWRRPEIQSVSACLVLLITTWMITPLSRVVWENIPLLQLTQFPWRFLSVQAFGAAWVTGFLVLRLGRRRQWIVLVLVGLVGVIGMVGLRPERLLVKDSEVTTERLMLYEAFTGNIGTTVRHEYLPSAVAPRPYASVYSVFGEDRPAVMVLTGQVGQMDVLSADATRQRWVVDVSSPEAVLAFQTHFYLGWQARVDGKRVELDATEGTGCIRILLPEGEHEVDIYFGRIPGRAVLECLSLAAALVLLLLVRPWPRSRIAPNLVAGTGLLIVLALVFRVSRALPPDMGGQGNVTMDFGRLPYLHHNPNGVHFGKDLRLVSYSFSADEVNAGDVLEVTLQWKGQEESSSRILVQLSGMTQHLFGVSYPYSESEQPLTGKWTVHRLSVPVDVPPGEYLLKVTVMGEKGEVRPANEQGETLGTLCLRPIRVLTGGRFEASQPSLGDFGPAIALTRARSTQVEQGKLRVQLTWQCRDALDRSYALSLRLKNSRGKVIASRDLPPFYGAYPTNIWQPGDEVTDHQVLSLPEGIAPGMGYSLEVILYELPSLSPIGSAVVKDVSVTMPTVRPVKRVVHQYDAELALKKMEAATSEVHAGEAIAVRVMWAATEAPTRNYACRLGLLDLEGKAVSLSARLPITPEYSTSTWPQYTLIEERYSLPIQVDTLPGVYVLAVELVDAETGESFGVYLSSSQVTVHKPQ